jgi:threonine/homoserine/homoserine lactone efflux protein
VSAVALATVFAAGFLIMTPVGPVSTICIRRALLHGSWAGIAAGAGDALAVAVYATIGVAGGDLLPRFFAPYAKVWHIVVALVLVLVAVIIWRSRPLMPKTRPTDSATLAGGFGATLAIALANPADIVLFGALFAGLGIALYTPLACARSFRAHDLCRRLCLLDRVGPAAVALARSAHDRPHHVAKSRVRRADGRGR